MNEDIHAEPRLREAREQKLEALRNAIIAGEQSGPMHTIDREVFKEEMRRELHC